jgi:alkyl hydroperoxide reductase subunit AhpC
LRDRQDWRSDVDDELEERFYMDPNVTLLRIRDLVSNTHLIGDEVDELADLIDALDGWISNGGFLPSDWETIKEV